MIDIIPPVINAYKRDPDYLDMRNDNTKDVVAQFNRLTKLVKQWNRTWRQDYLQSLREHHYGGKPAQGSCSLTPGDIVLIDSDTPRSTWSVGKVEAVYPDQYGVLRVVKVLFQGRSTLRTIDKLLPLEISSNSFQEDNVQAQESVHQRPRRAAAQQARARWQTQQNVNNL